jgi:two-component system OmpR family response regulator
MLAMIEGRPGAGIHALMIEDDERLAQLTTRYLAVHGIEARYEVTGPAGLDEALRGRYDVILLDVMLPGRDGVEVCRSLRTRSDVPVIMLTACGTEADRVLGLESGADDYLTKPFSTRELLARVRAVVRRSRGQAGPGSRSLCVGSLALDPGNLRVEIDGVPVPLTSFEFQLLYALAERAGRVLTREQLLDLVHGSAEEAFDRSIDTHVSRLRKKLGDDPRQPQLLLTVRGVGYMLARKAAS